ncbi:2-hydroxyacyl-CoA dehydratase subunit D [Bacillus sp. EB600]|uniref:2-hydroxyacyl-CoA dehydratase subunit D n=1 Tax=Bacillus sp. EB600 TaxID=2806345 RepID=UPI00210EEA15|nr:2-hydroxyacyl-CoA dehydratase family protein [Bacillus sp. EB600]MCQ6281672.1 2-hydroxyacyl-CoA dehydratase [Bacillus sp. EB600]
MYSNLSADEILSQLASIAANPYERAKEWKMETGSKVVGCYIMHFPEELIHAAGALPIVLQVKEEPITSGHAYYPSYFCGPTRSIVDQAAKGDLEFLDGFVGGDYCIQVVGGTEVLGNLLPNANNMFFRLPVGNQPWTHGDIVTGLKELKRDIQRFTGNEISDESISKSIRIYNKNRSLIREIYALKSENPGLLTASEMLSIIKSSMVMPKEEHNAILETLVPKLAKQKDSRGSDAVRVFISGSLCGAPKSEVLSLIEESGAVVVGDDLFHGLRYTSNNIAEEREPLDAIALNYLDKNTSVPCPTRCDPKTDWPQYLVDSVRKNKADQLVILMTQFCEPHMFFYPDIKDAMQAEGIPHLLLEISHELDSIETIKTRLEAFVEMAV